ncbi:MAG: sugar transferase [Pseudomonadota bacterium]
MLKRVFDIFLALVLAVLLSPLLIGVALWMILRRDLPIFYVSERMKTVDTPFDLVKFRTMDPPGPDDANTGVSGGDKAARISPLGRVLRRYRLDELPQLWNVLKGDLSFVGPRPPLRQYTDRFPDLYAQVLRSKPGLTGLATLTIHRFEETALARARSVEETEAIYVRRCIPRKARVDLLYQRRAGVCFDIQILYRTARAVFFERSA